MSHLYSKRVRFGEVDQAQIVYYPRLFHYCHLAMEDFCESELGLPYAVVIKERRIGFPTVHVEADFTAPMPFGADLSIEVSYLRIGKSSVTTRYRFTDQNRVCVPSRSSFAEPKGGLALGWAGQ